MSFPHCPHCQSSTFAPTGAFWLCTDCGIAITSQALAPSRIAPKQPKRRNNDLLSR